LKEVAPFSITLRKRVFFGWLPIQSMKLFSRSRAIGGVSFAVIVSG